MNNSCTHKQWVGSPVGYVPTHWQCSKCQIKITAGEMLIFTAINKLSYQLSKVEVI